MTYAAYMPIVDGFPRPDWAAIDALIAQRPEAEGHEQWCDAARTWLAETARHLGAPYEVSESPEFLFLMPFAGRHAKLIRSFAEAAAGRVADHLGDLADAGGYGKRVLLVFADQDSYYAYCAPFYPEGEHPLSAGVFINAAYGHIALPFYDVTDAEATVAHELTHCLLRHLPIPLWLNEGLAVTVENEICGNRPLRMDPERLAEHAEFWNEATIQEFWNGRSFGRVDEGVGLSYELARYCIRALAHDLPDFVAFAKQASFQDGGEAAAVAVFGGSLGGLIEQFFGPGDWSPRADAPTGSRADSPASRSRP